jgi:hypothetical protein
MYILRIYIYIYIYISSFGRYGFVGFQTQVNYKIWIDMDKFGCLEYFLQSHTCFPKASNPIQHNQKPSSLLLMSSISRTYMDTNIKFFQMQIVVQILRETIKQ